ncbi:MAG: recombinase XerC [Nitrospira sp.]|jgi:integrase/recombinase XerD|nr:recombinase XerC [Nitrospira sp.]
MSTLYRYQDPQKGVFRLKWYCKAGCPKHPKGGGAHCVSLRTRDGKRARSLQDEKDRQLDQEAARLTLGLQAPKAASRDMLLTEFRDFYLERAEKDQLVGLDTLYRNHQPMLNKLVEFAPTATLEDLTLAWVERYQSTVRRRYADYGWNSRRATLRGIFNRAVEWRLIGENPFVALQRVKRPQATQPKRLYQEQLPIILRHERKDFWKLVTLFLYITGCRLMEMARLERTHVRPELGYFGIVKNKEKRVKRIPLTTVVLKIINRAQSLSDSPYVFPWKGGQLTRNTVTRHYDRLSEKCGFKVSAHRFRHAHGTHALELGSNLKAIQDTLGHSDIRTTADFYIDVDLKHIQKSMDALDGETLFDGSNLVARPHKTAE